MEAKTAQIRAINPNTIHSEERFVTPTRARFLIDSGAFELVNAPGPTQRPVAGPTETKPAAPAETKQLSGSAGGPSTDFPASIESGQDAPSQFSEEGQASQDPPVILSDNPPQTVKRGPGRPKKLEQSQ